MANCLVIFPPQWSPFSPHLAPVSIVSNLRKAGYKCDVFDFNADFYLEILNKEYLEKVIIDQIQSMADLNKELQNIVSKDKTADDYTLEEQIKIKKMLLLEDIRKNQLDKSKNIIDNVENAVYILHNNDLFYDLKLVSNSLGIINKALEIASLQEFPMELSLYNFENSTVRPTWNGVLQFCSKDNIFSRFYKEKIQEIVDNKYDCIGISISSATQLLAGFTLAKMLKERVTKTKIFMGGNHISRIIEGCKKNPDFFKIFADYVLFEEGERPAKELIEYIEGKRNIEDVSSLLYLDENGEVRQTERKDPMPLSEIAMPDLQGFDIKKYFLPEIIMPVQLSRGCYWKKCTFCDHYFGQTYNVKDYDRLINELKTLQEKYGINNFEFTDDCISPVYLKEFSEKLIASGLKINWYCDLRLENAFTQEILDLAYKAGLKMVLWGYEAGSKRVMELINKGVDIDNRMEIMKRAANAGIYNFAYVFTGFPTETYEEARETINAVCHNPDIVHFYGMGNFSLGRHSLINSSPEKFGITKLEDEEFSADANYTVENALSKEELENLDQEFIQESLKERTNPASMFLLYRELLFLYIVKYGRDNVLNMSYEM